MRSLRYEKQRLVRLENWISKTANCETQAYKSIPADWGTQILSSDWKTQFKTSGYAEGLLDDENADFLIIRERNSGTVETAPPPYLRVWMTAPPPYVKKKCCWTKPIWCFTIKNLAKTFGRTLLFRSCASTSKETLFHPEQSVQLQLNCSSNPVEVSKFFRVTLHWIAYYKLQVPLRQSYLHINLCFRSSHHHSVFHLFHGLTWSQQIGLLPMSGA